MTTSDEAPGTEKRGRHAEPADEQETTGGGNRPATDEAPAPDAAPPEDAATTTGKRRRFRLRRGTAHPVGRHPAGTALLTSSGLLLGLFVAPVILDRLDFDVFDRAARAAYSAATRWPGGGEPWFWPNWVAVLAGIVAILLIGVAVASVKLPDVVVAAAAVVLVLATARAAWATLDVVNARLWDLLTVCVVCLIAFGLAVSGLVHWRSPDDDAEGSGVAAAANSAVAGVVVALLVLIAGAGIARFREEGTGPAGPPRAEAGLLATRAADVAAARDLDGPWVPQVAAEQIGDDDAATAFSAGHGLWDVRFPSLLLRGDDVDADDLDDGWWLTVAAQGFPDEAGVRGWCAGNGLAPEACVPRELA